jgi:hypothetical protein
VPVDLQGIRIDELETGIEDGIEELRLSDGSGPEDDDDGRSVVRPPGGDT